MPSRVQTPPDVRRRARAVTPRGPSPSEPPSDGYAFRLPEFAKAEPVAYILIVAIGCLLRVLFVDSRPLSMDEGSLAAQSYRIMMGQFGEALKDGPLQTYATALMLGLFAGSDGAARMLSVIAGGAMLAVPYMLRDTIGRKAALIATIGFAVSPLFLYASRTVGSGIVPTLLSLLLWWVVERRMHEEQWGAPLVALLVAGLIASGASGITAGLALGLAAILAHPEPALLLTRMVDASGSATWKRAALLFVAAVVAIAASLGANPAGIQSVLVDEWAAWLGSFSLSAPRGGLLLTLGLYELPVGLIALVGAVLTLIRRDHTGTLLALWSMLLLLLSMLQPAAGLPGVVMALAPIYLLASRTVAGSLALLKGAEAPKKWLVGLGAVLVPVLVGFVLLNRASVLQEPTPPEFLYGEVALVLVAAIAFVLLGENRIAVAWSALAIGSIAFMLHTSAFLNYGVGTQPSELIIGQQISPELKRAARDASYYSTYFDARVAVDPQLRAPLDWYLKSARQVDYTSEPSQGISIAFADQAQASLPAGSERIPGLYSPTMTGTRFTWTGLWGWAMTRGGGLVRQNPRDIIIRTPASVW